MSEIPAPQKVAIITGASSGTCMVLILSDALIMRSPRTLEGIGRETAITLSANNWRLVLTARRFKELEGTARLCSGYQPYVIAADMTNERDVQRVFEAAQIQYGLS